MPEVGQTYPNADLDGLAQELKVDAACRVCLHQSAPLSMHAGDCCPQTAFRSSDSMLGVLQTTCLDVTQAQVIHAFKGKKMQP